MPASCADTRLEPETSPAGILIETLVAEVLDKQVKTGDEHAKAEAEKLLPANRRDALLADPEAVAWAQHTLRASTRLWRRIASRWTRTAIRPNCTGRAGPRSRGSGRPRARRTARGSPPGDSDSGDPEPALGRPQTPQAAGR